MPRIIYAFIRGEKKKFRLTDSQAWCKDSFPHMSKTDSGQAAAGS